MSVLGLRCFVGFDLVVVSWGYALVVSRLLTAVASLVAYVSRTPSITSRTPAVRGRPGPDPPSEALEGNIPAHTLISDLWPLGMGLKVSKY